MQSTCALGTAVNRKRNARVPLLCLLLLIDTMSARRFLQSGLFIHSQMSVNEERNVNII